eukprot:4241142-Karenia_brevis.AAC.1
MQQHKSFKKLGINLIVMHHQNSLMLTKECTQFLCQLTMQSLQLRPPLLHLDWFTVARLQTSLQFWNVMTLRRRTNAA